MTSSTPNLQQTWKIEEHHMTLKQKQSIIPSKSMAIEDAEDFVRKAWEKIQKLKESASKGGVD